MEITKDFMAFLQGTSISLKPVESHWNQQVKQIHCNLAHDWHNSNCDLFDIFTDIFEINNELRQMQFNTSIDIEEMGHST